MKKSSTSPIFIVGMPRSGTTLLAGFITRHSQVACGPETNFFCQTSKPKIESILHQKNWQAQAHKTILSLKLSGQSVYKIFGLSPDKIQAYLEESPPTVASLLESLTFTYARQQGKTRWAEKTPYHLLYLSRIREAFPDACIIRIVRDPRDCALSLQRLPWGSSSAIAHACDTSQWFEKSYRWFEQDSQNLTVLYENLVKDPEGELQQICQFAQLPYEGTMLDANQPVGSLISPKESWKSQSSKSIDKNRLEAWKRADPALQQVLTFITSEQLEYFGYEIPEQPHWKADVYPMSSRIVERQEALFYRFTRSGMALKNSGRLFDEPNLLVLPQIDRIYRDRSLRVLRLLRVLIGRKLAGKKTYYDPETLDRLENPYERVNARLLRRLAQPISADLPEKTENLVN